MIRYVLGWMRICIWDPVLALLVLRGYEDLDSEACFRHGGNGTVYLCVGREVLTMKPLSCVARYEVYHRALDVLVDRFLLFIFFLHGH